MPTQYIVQTGKGRGKYKTRYVFDNLDQATVWYLSLNIHSGYKKRLIDTTGRVHGRRIT
jgi:uncharacterized protein YhbP (UPF0306 family)